ncbi:YdeI/OmpD-associated family protein [Capnocytophaga sp.]|uniref:YdeI/OmpD-associated family protein n=1 Tax=Capnocytophaga sp. TaxID=44737 RepID=UPI0026DA8D4A|nr:YdeI/OmpD-associated family protein [Capnocytophaga sp.]MDO5104993.1 YdeI/OmpD-associated family protein [Capnocytophaga sp.]
MKLLTDKTYTIEKFEGKGGWSFVQLPEIKPDKNAPFGWVRVFGTIDGYAIEKYHLQSMGNGKLFLPLKAEIRKKIGKQTGDSVHIVLYEDNTPSEIAHELKMCLQDEPHLLKAFESYSEAKQKKLIDWIYQSKNEDDKAQRIVEIINKISDEL